MNWGFHWSKAPGKASKVSQVDFIAEKLKKFFSSISIKRPLCQDNQNQLFKPSPSLGMIQSFESGREKINVWG